MQGLEELIRSRLANPGDLVIKNLGSENNSVGLVLEVYTKKNMLYCYRVLTADKGIVEWIYLFVKILNRA